MSHILLVKTSSLGDVIHNLPIVSDLISHQPEARIDWVVEEAFADVPRLHPSVRNVIPVAIRRWRKAWLNAAHRSEINAFIGRLRSSRYDVVLDSQGLIKSAIITRLARGERIGYDRNSAREPWATWFYDRRIAVPLGVHAVERNRELAAAAFGYAVDTPLNYGIRASSQGADRFTEKPYAVLIHATSRADKQWPEANWIAVGNALRERGFVSLLPGGNQAERARSQALASRISGAAALPATSLSAMAGLLAQAKIVVGVDTGITHLACALKAPVIAIYSGSSPALTGVYGGDHAVNIGDLDDPPSADTVIAAMSQLLSAC